MEPCSLAQEECTDNTGSSRKYAGFTPALSLSLFLSLSVYNRYVSPVYDLCTSRASGDYVRAEESGHWSGLTFPLRLCLSW